MFLPASNSLTFVKRGLKFKKRPFKKLKTVRAPHRRPASKNARLNTRISKALHNILELAHFRLMLEYFSLYLFSQCKARFLYLTQPGSFSSLS